MGRCERRKSMAPQAEIIANSEKLCRVSETHADGWCLLIPVLYCRAGAWPRPVSSLLQECSVTASTTPARSGGRSQHNLRHRGSLHPTRLPRFVSCPREQSAHPRPNVGQVMAWPLEETARSLPFLQESGIVTSVNGVFIDLNGGQMVKILLRERESIQEAVRRFRKIVERSGLKKEMRKREVYEKPSVTKRRAKLRAVRRAQAQRKP